MFKEHPAQSVGYEVPYVPSLPYISANMNLSQSTNTSRKHIMISYNWGNQLAVVKLAKALQAIGYSVWLDVEQMRGSTLEASMK